MTPTRVFLHYLDRLALLLRRIEASAGNLGEQRLHPDMFTLLQQARTAIGFSLRTCCPLAGRPIVSFAGDEHSFASVQAELTATRDYLAAIPPEAFANIGATQVDTTAGFADLRLAGWDYYLMYALPNFFFHYAMVYATARQAGVPVGKADFDGFHDYPLGFNFSNERDLAA